MLSFARTTTNTIQVRVQGNGVPVSNDTRSFSVVVNPLAAPDGTSWTLELEPDAQKGSCALPLPSGGSPLGTGHWCVPSDEAVTATSEFGLNRLVPG